MPTPEMVLEIAKAVLAEIEALNPGLIDRAISRLDNEGERLKIIKLRGVRAAPVTIRAQEDALLWLMTLRPLMAAPGKKRRR